QPDDGERVPNSGFRRLQQRESPAPGERQNAAEQGMTQGERLVQQQPHRQEACRQERERKKPPHVPPVLRVACGGSITSCTYAHGMWSDWAVACMYCMIGPA